MLCILDSLCIRLVVLGIEVGNNLSLGSFLLLFFLGEHKFFHFFDCRHSLEACALNKLFDVILLDKIVDMLIGDSYNALYVNLRLSLDRLADRIHPTADNLSGIGCLCDTCSIRTNDLLLASIFFLINSSGFD